MPSTRFKGGTKLTIGAVENIYLNLTDDTPTPLTDLTDADSVSYNVINSKGNFIQGGTPVISTMILECLIDTSVKIFVGTDEVQTITVTADSGTWSASYNGNSTDPLAFDVTDTDLATALQQLDLEINGITVSLTGSTYTISFISDLSYNPQTIQVTDIDLVGTSHSVEVLTTVPYKAPIYWYAPGVYNLYVQVVISSETVWAGPYPFKVEAP